MRRLAIAQLGTADSIDDSEFAQRVAKISIQKILPRALLCVAKIHPHKKHQDALKKAAQACKKNPTGKTAKAAARAAGAAQGGTKNAPGIVRAAANAARAAANACYAAQDAAKDVVYAATAAASAATAAAYAANVVCATSCAAKNVELEFFAEEIVQVLISMKAQGTEWLD